MKKNLTSYITMGLAIGALTLGGSLSAYAATSTTSAATTTQQGHSNRPGHGFGRMDTSSLVTAGTIDQATADKISAYMQSNKGQKGTDPYSAMVTAGVITQAQADAIKAAAPKPSANGQKQGRGGKMDFSSLVTAGTIDQATADKITAYMTSKDAARQAEMEKVKAMTDTERQAYFESNKDQQRTSPFSEMVTAGILTQTQADAIEAAMPKPGNDGGHRGIGGKMDLSSLVTAGTIDQATADKISAYMETQKPDMFGDMVTAGVLTQTQADAIKAATPQSSAGNHKGFGGKMDLSALVTAGTIDQATADKITAYTDSKNAARKAEMDKVKAMTDAERQAYFESNKDQQRPDPLSAMVTAGVITQAQADAIKAAQPQPPTRATQNNNDVQ